MTISTESSSGWDAISSVLDQHYPGQKPAHYGTLIKWKLGGPDPLDGASVFQHNEGQPHWHYVSYGLSELYDKESENLEVSGFGFEFTFRLACDDPTEPPPTWPIHLMQNLARYVFRSGNRFAPGHHLDLNGPITDVEPTKLTAAIFVVDPILAETTSVNGRFMFLQIVGITHDELDAVQAWNCDKFAALLQRKSSLWVTDLKRPSLLANRALANDIKQATSRDGSSLGCLFVTTFNWRRKNRPQRISITIDEHSVPGFVKQLRGRVGHNRELSIIGTGDGPEHRIQFVPGPELDLTSAEDESLIIALPVDAVERLSKAIAPVKGTYRATQVEGLEVVVVATNTAG